MIPMQTLFIACQLTFEYSASVLMQVVSFCGLALIQSLFTTVLKLLPNFNGLYFVYSRLLCGESKPHAGIHAKVKRK